MTIKTAKLAALRQHLLAGGADDATALASLLGLPEEAVPQYREALELKYPEDFPPAAEEEDTTKFFLLNATGTMTEMDLVKQKGDVVVFRIKEPKEIVALIVKGAQVEVDLYQLRKLPGDAVQHGVTVARLIELAEIAKA